MKKEEITALFGKFESISCEVEGIECWSARELQPLLGYAKWDNFINNVVVKAKEACRNAGDGDSRKLQVAFAQTYFAVQTRKAEVIEQRLLDCDMLLQRGIKPERLSPDEDIKKVQRRINKDNKKNLKNK